MMVANSSNLIITVKPVNQRMTLATQRGGLGRHSNVSSSYSHVSHQSQVSNISARSYDSEQQQQPEQEEDDDDEVHDHLSPTSPPPSLLGPLEDSGSGSGKQEHGHVEDRDGSEQGSQGKGSSRGSTYSEGACGGDRETDPIVTL